MTPVSVLQELCAKKGVTPQYDTIGQEGDSHQPIFTIRCIAGGSMGSGQGHSKKDAKQAAAKDLLEQLGVDTSAFESQQSNRWIKVIWMFSSEFNLRASTMSFIHYSIVLLYDEEDGSNSF